LAGSFFNAAAGKLLAGGREQAFADAHRGMQLKGDRDVPVAAIGVPADGFPRLAEAKPFGGGSSSRSIWSRTPAIPETNCEWRCWGRLRPFLVIRWLRRRLTHWRLFHLGCWIVGNSFFSAVGGRLRS